jgi:hypothetical protein
LRWRAIEWAAIAAALKYLLARNTHGPLTAFAASPFMSCLPLIWLSASHCRALFIHTSFELPRVRLAPLAENGRTRVYQPAIEQVDGPGFVRGFGTKSKHYRQENDCRWRNTHATTPHNATFAVPQALSSQAVNATFRRWVSMPIRAVPDIQLKLSAIPTGWLGRGPENSPCTNKAVLRVAAKHIPAGRSKPPPKRGLGHYWGSIVAE